MNSRIDLAADLNDEDDEGLGWSTLSEARDPGRIRPGVMLVAGNRQAQAVVRVVAVDDDGHVHFTVVPGSVEKTRHLIGRALAGAPGSRPHGSRLLGGHARSQCRTIK